MSIIKTARGLFTFTIMGFAILVFLGHGFLIRALTSDPHLRKRKLLRNINWYSRLALRLMRVKVIARGRTPADGENFLMVSNHMSYLDMIVLASVQPSVFVTSVDMGQVFFLGTMAEIGGSLFVERRNRDRIDHDVAQIEYALNRGFDVTLFPEGTSGNGVEVLPFKRSLLTAALNSGTPVLPVTLKYFEIDGKPFSEENRDIVCWYGRQSFLPHFFRLLSVKSVSAKVTFGAPVRAEVGMTKHTLTDDLHRTISREYREPLVLGL